MQNTLSQKPTVSLTDEQIEFFHQNGYIALPQISTPAEIAMMREAYDRIFAQKAGRDEGNQFDLAGTDEDGKEAALPQILNPSKYAPELWDTVARANALNVLQQIFGPEVEANGDHAIFKPAHHGAPTPWHQDEAYWNPDMDYQSVSVWMPLQDVDEENGCMQFIPGSHRQEVLSHQPINNDPRIHGLEVTDEVEIPQPAICPLEAGGATIHASRTLHFTAPNNSPRPRRAYIMMFSVPPRRRDEIGLPARRFAWNETRRTARDERARAVQS